MEICSLRNGNLYFAKWKSVVCEMRMRIPRKAKLIFLGGNFLFRISELTQRERKCSFRKLQIFISQTTDFHFANYRFSFRKLQISISQTTDSHFANYRFSFRKLQISISQTTDSHFANYRFPFRKLQIPISQTTDFHFHFVSSHFVSQTTVSPVARHIGLGRSLRDRIDYSRRKVPITAQNLAVIFRHISTKLARNTLDFSQVSY